LASGPWFAQATQIGPFGNNPAPAGKASFTAHVHARRFDRSVTSSTGDFWLGTVDTSAPAATPLRLKPGESGTITVTITPTGPVGSLVRGTLFVDDVNPFTGAGDELIGFPYSYTVK
jgi:hypothetical protein